jgi:hypothetical protein
MRNLHQHSSCSKASITVAIKQLLSIPLTWLAYTQNAGAQPCRRCQTIARGWRLAKEEEVGWEDVLAVPVLAELARTKYAALFGLTCMARTAACMTDLGGSGSRLIEPVGEFVEPP